MPKYKVEGSYWRSQEVEVVALIEASTEAEALEIAEKGVYDTNEVGILYFDIGPVDGGDVECIIIEEANEITGDEVAQYIARWDRPGSIDHMPDNED